MIRVGQRRFEMPDPLEFPRMLSAIVPDVGRERPASFRGKVVSELVAFTFRHSIRRGRRFARRESRLEPRLSTVIRSLDDLTKPAARLRRVNPVRIHRRPFEVIHLPPRKKRPAYL